LRGVRERGAFYLRLDRVVWWYALIMLVLLALWTAPLTYVVSATDYFSLPRDARLPIQVPVGAAVALFILAFVLPRLSLVLPAAALGERLSAAEAWRASRGNTWRLLWASLLCSLPPYVLLSRPIDLFVRDETQVWSTVAETISSLVNVLIVAVGVTLLSLSYRHLVRREDVGGLSTQPGERGPAAA